MAVSNQLCKTLTKDFYLFDCYKPRYSSGDDMLIQSVNYKFICIFYTVKLSHIQFCK